LAKFRTVAENIGDSDETPLAMTPWALGDVRGTKTRQATVNYNKTTCLRFHHKTGKVFKTMSKVKAKF
jgi:hypothetical protein